MAHPGRCDGMLPIPAQGTMAARDRRHPPLLPPMLSAILWDNDGVLVDTERFYFQANRDYLRRHGVEPPKRSFSSGSWPTTAAPGTCSKRGRLPTHRSPPGKGERNALHLELIHAASNLMTPGIDTLLARLAGRVEMKHRHRCATRASLDAIHARLDLLRHFRFALTAETYERSKPAPDPYLLGLEHLGRPADEMPGHRGLTAMPQHAPRACAASCCAAI